MKTKDAFALRNFDETKILQRLWFKDFNLPIGSDEDVLLSFLNVFEKPVAGITPSGYLKVITPNQEGYLVGAIENLETITRLGDRTVFYEALLERHMIQLNAIQKSFVEKFMATEERIYKEKFIRTTDLLKRYRMVLNSTTALRQKITFKVQMLKELFEKDFRQRFFGSRLKQARKTAGLTQAELAERVGLKSYNPVTQYERGISDPSLPTLFRLATALNVKTDWLLGLN